MAETVPITLDRPRNLRYDWAAIKVIEQQTGVVVGELTKLFKPYSITNMIIVLRAGLLHEDPDITEDDVGRLVYGKKAVEVMEKVGEALAQGFGGEEVNFPTAMTETNQSGIGEKSTALPTAR